MKHLVEKSERHFCALCKNMKLIQGEKLKDQKNCRYFYVGCKKKPNFKYMLRTLTQRDYDYCNFYIPLFKRNFKQWAYLKFLYRNLPLRHEAHNPKEVIRFFKKAQKRILNEFSNSLMRNIIFRIKYDYNFNKHFSICERKKFIFWFVTKYINRRHSI